MRPKHAAFLIASAMSIAALACSSSTASLCGHDISALHSNVVALDPSTGRQIWNTEIPMAGYVMPPAKNGEVHVPLLGSNEDARLAADTGKDLGRVASNHQLSVGPVATASTAFAASGDTVAPNPASGDIGPYIDGEPVPTVIDVGDLRIAQQTDADAHGRIEATNLETGEVVWQFSSDRVSVSLPTLVDGRVVVITSDPRPACP